jgi:hypothetical protein
MTLSASWRPSTACLPSSRRGVSDRQRSSSGQLLDHVARRSPDAAVRTVSEQPIRSPRAAPAGEARGGDPGGPGPSGEPPDHAPEGEPGAGPEPPVIEPHLLPPGPAARVQLSPDPIRLWPGGARRVRAIVTDIHGQTIAAATSWTASSQYVSIAGDGGARTIALAELADADHYVVTVVAEACGGAASTTADIVVIDGPPVGGPGAGIPEPVLVDEWLPRRPPPSRAEPRCQTEIPPLSGFGPDLGRLPTSLNYFEIYKFRYVDRFEAYPGVSRCHGK